MKSKYTFSIVVFMVVLAATARVFAQDTIVLPALKDNTLYEDAEGDTSNGAGKFIFVAHTNKGKLRRAVIAFDIESNIPSGSKIESVKLTLHLSRTLSNKRTVTLHKLMKDWGEAGSDAEAQEGKGTLAETGDATWIYTFYNTLSWSHQGGDFDTTILASTEVLSFDHYTWGSTEGMVECVQKWLDEPDNNFGWILIGEEDLPGDGKRFDSKENDMPENRPRLEVVYSEPTRISDHPGNPASIASAMNYPNPFSDGTTIEYRLTENAEVEIKVLNILGQEVITLLNDYQHVGIHSVTWDGKNGNGKVLNNGIYYAYIRSGKELTVLKILKTQ